MPAPTSSGSGSLDRRAPVASGRKPEDRHGRPKDKRVHIDLPAGVIWVDGSPVGKILSSVAPGGTELKICVHTDRVFEVLQSIADTEDFCEFSV